MNIIKRFKLQEDQKKNQQNNIMKQTNEDTISFDDLSIYAGAEKVAISPVNIDTPYLDFNFNNSQDMINNVAKYKEDIDYASKKWGVSPNIIGAIMSQESSAGTAADSDNIMEIKFDCHKDEIKTVYNFAENKYEKIVLTDDVDNPLYKNCDSIITQDDLKNEHTAISVGTAILASCAKNRLYNIPLAIQDYNLGYGNVNKILTITRDKEGYNSVADISDDQKNLSFTKYTYYVTGFDNKYGDKDYVKNVAKYINVYNNGNFDTVINIKKYNNGLIEDKQIRILPENMK